MTSEATGTTARQRHGGLRWEGVASIGAFLGGVFWMVKSAAVLTTGAQPPLLFELAPLPLAMAALAMARLAKNRVAAVLSLVAVGAGAVYSLSWLAGLDSPAFGLVLLVGMLSLHAALVVAGPALLRAQAFGRWSVVPLAIGLATVPLLVLGGALAAASDRLLELPLLLLGAAWAAFGARLWRARAAAPVG